MAVNLAVNYSGKIAGAFTNSSYIKGRTCEDFDFMGVAGLRIFTPQTVDLNDYQRSGNNRYGVPKEMQDTVSELIMARDRSFALTIDKGNNESSMLNKNAGKMLRLQIEEKVVPEADKYALLRMANYAGTIAEVDVPSKTNIVDLIADGMEKLDEANVPLNNRYIYVATDVFKYLAHSPELLSVSNINEEALAKGIVGEIHGAKVIKVPKPLMPKNCYFIICSKASVIMPYKIEDAKLHMDPPGINGALLEGRNLYDFFVIGSKASGVYAAVAKTFKLADATFACATPGTAPATITITGAEQILYTLDGTDPRFSATAMVYAGGIPTTSLKSGESITITAVGFSNSRFTSNVLVKTFTA